MRLIAAPPNCHVGVREFKSRTFRHEAPEVQFNGGIGIFGDKHVLDHDVTAIRVVDRIAWLDGLLEVLCAQQIGDELRRRTAAPRRGNGGQLDVRAALLLHVGTQAIAVFEIHGRLVAVCHTMMIVTGSPAARWLLRDMRGGADGKSCRLMLRSKCMRDLWEKGNGKDSQADKRRAKRC